MTRLELRDSLIDREGWKNDPSLSLTVSAENQTSDSGRYFQDEHSIVRLKTIHEITYPVDANESDFNDVLEDLRKVVIFNVIDDVFEESIIAELDLEGNENQFDAAISKKMTIKIAEILMTTERVNFTERKGKDFLKNIFFEINGNPNFPDKVSIASMYRKEIDYLRDIYNSVNMLDSITLTNNTGILKEDQYRV